MHDVAIVGAGFAGIGMAIRLKRRGVRDVVLLERAGEIGGTWRDNAYPGCACDIPSMLYSFSFAANPDWTRSYPRREEIWRYLRDCVARFGIAPMIRTGADVVEAVWDEGPALWRVRLGDGEALDARVLIWAAGALHRPHVPPLPGIEIFAGTAVHSSAWSDAVDVRGKDVAAIGTGASAIQIVPAIAADVRSLTLFQRTPAWVVPRGDEPVRPLRRMLRRFVPGFAWLERKAIYWALEARAYGFTVNPAMLRMIEGRVRRALERSIADPTLRAALTPDYRIGCKRILLADDYYPALQRKNVRVVTSAIAGVRERSVVTADGEEHPADVIVYATGFRATDVPDARVVGRLGVTLAGAWREGMEAYLGTSVAGFPNLFFLVGPNTGLGHNSMVLMMEAQYRYVLSALELMKRRRLRALDVRADVQRRYNERLQTRLARTVWATGCTSWYRDRNGKITALWPGFTFTFRALTRRLRPERYHLTS
ncbi:MAG TPA: NAD(P)/FAD-dependent oxidoreductase [Candidatus Baltobacteraceae bacterium]|nr:NAD(P)/FAD-dependent oxidoreductase [Candidatus Baltobacteraceae bacterium]